MKNNLEDTTNLLQSLANGDREAIQFMFDKYYPRVLGFVKENRGTVEDAKDLFQECLFYLFRYIGKPDNKTIENLESYFRTMYRNRWYHHLAKVGKEKELRQNYEAWPDEEDQYYFIYLKAFEMLGDDCKKVLRYYVEGKNTEELAILLDTSLDYAKRKKYLCKENLKKIATKLLNKFDQ